MLVGKSQDTDALFKNDVDGNARIIDTFQVGLQGFSHCPHLVHKLGGGLVVSVTLDREYFLIESTHGVLHRRNVNPILARVVPRKASWSRKKLKRKVLARPWPSAVRPSVAGRRATAALTRH